MIIRKKTENGESKIFWKNSEDEGWRSANVEDLINAYEQNDSKALNNSVAVCNETTSDNSSKQTNGLYWAKSPEYERILEILEDYWLEEPEEDFVYVRMIFLKGDERQAKAICWRNPKSQMPPKTRKVFKAHTMSEYMSSTKVSTLIAEEEIANNAEEGRLAKVFAEDFIQKLGTDISNETSEAIRRAFFIESMENVQDSE